MCPFCIATAAVVAASASGTGGLAALFTGKLMKRTAAKKFPETFDPKEVRHGYDDDESKTFSSGFAQRVD